MTSEKREPFEMRGDGWYKEPLDYQTVIYEPNHETHVARLTMNRPEVMNALNHTMRAELIHALKVAERDPEINVIILKGAGRCFSAGYDLGGGNVGEEPDFGSQYVGIADTEHQSKTDSHWHRHLVNAWWQIWELSKIVIAQTHGYVLAGGTDLMCMCDLLVTTPDCQFGYPPVRAMNAPDLLWFPYLLPKHKAAEMVYTGDSLSGAEIHRFGMANYCVPIEDIDEFTDVFARRVAMIPWQMNTLRKRTMQKAYELMGIRTAMEINAQTQGHYSMTERIKEMGALMRRVPLKDYLEARDAPYRELRAKEQEILERGKGKR